MQNRLLPGYRPPGEASVPSVAPVTNAILQGVQDRRAFLQREREQANADRQFGLQREGMDFRRKQATREAEMAAERMRMQQEQHGESMDMRRQQMKLERERLGLTKTQFDEERKQRGAQRAGRLALAILNDSDQARAAANWQKMVQASPQFAKQLQRYGQDPSDWRSGARFIAAEAGMLPEPSAAMKPTDDIQEYEFAKRNGFAGSFEDWINRRASRSPAGLTSTDRKAVLEADEKAAASRNVLEALNQAEQLSKSAYSGFGAETRASIVSGVNPYATPDADATLELANLTTAQALEQLKVVFGGMPTEGERKILLDIQGSPGQPRDVREAIYKRAKEAVQRRMQDAQSRAQALRSGTYYEPGGGPSLMVAPPQGGIPTVNTVEEARKLPPGTRFRTPDGRVKVVPGG